MAAAFGSKAGLVPLHVWLPRAHPAAPSHVSALMSAAMVNLGVYGLTRVVFDLLPPGPPWWGGVLLAAGAVVHGAHSVSLEAFGGLIKRMPRTALLSLVGALALAGLPPLNGFP